VAGRHPAGRGDRALRSPGRGSAQGGGLILPGETAILAAGVLARDGHLQIVLVLPIAAVAAIMGDNVGYLLGRRGARQLLLLLSAGIRAAWRRRRGARSERPL
jgi:membrane protein DedA with SNARE-associated domain